MSRMPSSGAAPPGHRNPEVYAEPPYFRTGKEAWEQTFRFGPAGSWHPDPERRRTHEGLRFPVAAFDAFLCQCVPRWGCNDALTQCAYDCLLQRLSQRGIVLTHSQGGNFGLTAAATAPDRVRAVISLEPSGAPDPAEHDPRRLADVPHLFVWGDYLDRHSFWLRVTVGGGALARRTAQGRLRCNLARTAYARYSGKQPCPDVR